MKKGKEGPWKEGKNAKEKGKTVEKGEKKERKGEEKTENFFCEKFALIRKKTSASVPQTPSLRAYPLT